MHRTAALVAAALLASAAGLPSAAPAVASPTPHADSARAPEPAAVPAEDEADTPEEPEKPRGLFLTVSGSENTWIRGVLLHCAPEPAGPHPRAAAACAALDEAQGDMDRLPGDGAPCTKQYDPVTVSATGAWRGRPTAWHKTYPNACELAATTGAVFRF
ncbi:SSI family serine proteinase inhibitor [Streptomyces sp. NPDC005805]|uniref:SSI family serine proteinase inhibitor n=1 Tax=Streptomyces sp. NPDC005805 TaxID=3157068 RepID=UPI0033C82A94